MVPFLFSLANIRENTAAYRSLQLCRAMLGDEYKELDGHSQAIIGAF